MKMLNINRKTDDIFYRYKMPKLEIQLDRKGHSVRTILINISSIAHALHRSAIYIAKFFAYEFGTSVQSDSKESSYFIRGEHDYKTLQNALYKFIERFVLCPKCNNPETEFVVRGQRPVDVFKECAACGYRGKDNMESHKLTTYISRNPPNNTKKQSSNKYPQATNEYSTNDISDHDDEDFGNDLLLTETEPSDQLVALIEKRKNEKKLNHIATINQIITEAERLNLTEKAPLIISQYLFTKNILKEMDEYKILLQELCKKYPRGQMDMLHALEILINDHEEIQTKISEVLYEFYEKDIIEENTFIIWYQKSSNCDPDKKICEMANEFIQWLNKAEDTESKPKIDSEAQ